MCFKLVSVTYYHRPELIYILNMRLILQLKNKWMSTFDVMSSGPNSGSSRTKAVEGRPSPPPASSSSTHPDGEEKSVLSVKESASCDLQRCHGNGRCIAEGRATRCRCLSGFRGEFCEESVTGRSHAATVLAVLFLVILLTAAAFLFIKRYR